LVIHHTIRRPAVNSVLQASDDGLVLRKIDQLNTNQEAATRTKFLSVNSPVYRVHIDDSWRSSPAYVRRHLPGEPELLKGRIQLINIWRPIKTVLKDPLAICNAATVSEDDLVPLKIIWPDRESETFAVRPSRNGEHKFHYLFQQTPEEVTMIKIFDSKTDGRARGVPHSAFVDEEFAMEVPRESIEVRALVFHPDDKD
jgi:hypothetical protein